MASENAAPPPRTVLLGCGAAGRGVVAALAGRIELVAALDPARAGERLGGLTIAAASGLPADVDLLLLAVPDDALPDLAADLASRLPAGAAPAVLQLSAASPAEALAPLAAAGCPCGLLHPMQSFPRGGEEPPPVGFWGLSGDEAARALARRLLEGTGAEWRELAEEERLPYHLCGVLAGNLPQALLAIAEGLWPGGDGEEARRALGPILERALANTLRLGPAAALSGPLARGDRGTALRHMAWLVDRDPELAALYASLAGELLAARGEPRGPNRVSTCSRWLTAGGSDSPNDI